ncbi:MAG: class I SAM-dependent methyltransferase [Flavobacteriales bacterium]
MENTSCPLCSAVEFDTLIHTPIMMKDDEQDAEMQFVICLNCDFIYFNPRVPVQKIKNYYPTYYLSYQGAKAWGKYARLVEFGLKRELKKRLKMVLKSTAKPHGRLLDLGCGRPEFLRQFQQSTHWEVTGIDFDSSAWQEERFAHLNLHEGDIAEMDLRAFGKFDVITLWHYLEHDYNPAHTLRRLKDVANAETHLIIEVPNYDSLTRKWQSKHWQGFHTPRHTGVYTPETLAKMLHNHGWKVKKQYTYGSLDPFVLWWLGEREKKKLNWNKSMESEFPKFLLQKLISSPLFSLERFISLGVQTTVAVPD